MVRDRPGNGALKAGSRATPTYEPRQIRKEAAVSGRWWVPRGCLTGATGPCDDRAAPWSTAGARSPPSLMRGKLGVRGSGGSLLVAEDIAYQSLYRKYRPLTPDDVIGQ